MGGAHLGTHILVESPGRERGNAGRGDERRVDRGPCPWVRPLFGSIEHAARFQRSQDAVVDQDEGDSQQERHPVLVEGKHDDQHEEVEVRLDQTAGVMDQQGRRGEQTERGGCRAKLA